METILFIIFVLIVSICIYYSYNKYLKQKEPEKTIYIPVEDFDLDYKEVELLRLFNEHRQSIGLNSLIPEKLACEICYNALLEDELLDEPTSHDGWYERIEATHGTGAEIIAYNFNTPYGMFMGYLSSPKHKAAIEKKEATHIGLSIYNRNNYCLILRYNI